MFIAWNQESMLRWGVVGCMWDILRIFGGDGIGTGFGLLIVGVLHFALF